MKYLIVFSFLGLSACATVPYSAINVVRSIDWSDQASRDTTDLNWFDSSLVWLGGNL